MYQNRFRRFAITLFRASESSPVEPGELQPEILQDSAWGWNGFSSEPVDIQFVPGDHVTMMTQPHVQVLAERLNASIKQRTRWNVVDWLWHLCPIHINSRSISNEAKSKSKRHQAKTRRH